MPTHSILFLLYTVVGRPVVTSGVGAYPYYGIPAVIAVNMIMAVAAGGTTAIVIAAYIQVRPL